MLSHPFFNRKHVLVICVATILFFLLTDSLKIVFDTVLIEPILSKAKPRLGITVFYLFFLSVAGFIVLHRLYSRAYKASLFTVYLLGSACALYWYDRGISHQYLNKALFYGFYTDFKFLDPLYATATIAWLILLSNLCRLFIKPSDENSTTSADPTNLLVQDIPIETIKHDQYQRNTFVSGLASKLLAIDFNNKRSFSLGINGEWGSGKTSVFHMLKKLLGESNNVECIDYNPWLSSTRMSLTQDIFIALQNKLGKYIETSNLVVKYGEMLSKIEDDKNPLRKIADLFNEQQSLDDQFDKISTLLTSVNARFFVFIDDLDRLDNAEILEVLKMIRNSVNFPNIVFVVAYDKEYVNKALENLKLAKSEKYLEKIFDMEVVLPKIHNSLLKDNLLSCLKNAFDFLQVTEQDKAEAMIHFNRLIINPDQASDSKTITVNKAIEAIFHSQRDINKFRNSFSTTYDAVKEHVFIPDLFILELIKFSNRGLFMALAKNDKYLNITSKDDIRTYSLYKEKEKNFQETEFSKLIGIERSSLYDIRNEKTTTTIGKDLIEALFSYPQEYTGWKNAIAFVDSFEGYFIHARSMQGVTFEEVDNLLQRQTKIHESIDLLKSQGKEVSLIEKLQLVSGIGSELEFSNYLSAVLYLIENSTVPATTYALLMKKITSEEFYKRIYKLKDYQPVLYSLLKQKAVAPFSNLSDGIFQTIREVIDHKESWDSPPILTYLSHYQLLDLNEGFLELYIQQNGYDRNALGLYYNCVANITGENRQIIISPRANKSLLGLLKGDPKNLIKYLTGFIRPKYSGGSPLNEKNHAVPEPFFMQIFGSADKFFTTVSKFDPANEYVDLMTDILNFFQLYFHSLKEGKDYVNLSQLQLNSNLHEYVANVK